MKCLPKSYCVQLSIILLHSILVTPLSSPLHLHASLSTVSIPHLEVVIQILKVCLVRSKLVSGLCFQGLLSLQQRN